MSYCFELCGCVTQSKLSVNVSYYHYHNYPLPHPHSTYLVTKVRQFFFLDCRTFMSHFPLALGPFQTMTVATSGHSFQDSISTFFSTRLITVLYCHYPALEGTAVFSNLFYQAQTSLTDCVASCYFLFHSGQSHIFSLTSDTWTFAHVLPSTFMPFLCAFTSLLLVFLFYQYFKNLVFLSFFFFF